MPWNTTSDFLKDFHLRINILLYFVTNFFLPIGLSSWVSNFSKTSLYPTYHSSYFSLLFPPISSPCHHFVTSHLFFHLLHSDSLHYHCKDILDQVFNGFHVENPMDASLFVFTQNSHIFTQLNIPSFFIHICLSEFSPQPSSLSIFFVSII